MKINKLLLTLSTILPISLATIYAVSCESHAPANGDSSQNPNPQMDTNQDDQTKNNGEQNNLENQSSPESNQKGQNPNPQTDTNQDDQTKNKDGQNNLENQSSPELNQNGQKLMKNNNTDKKDAIQKDEQNLNDKKPDNKQISEQKINSVVEKLRSTLTYNVSDINPQDLNKKDNSSNKNDAGKIRQVSVSFDENTWKQNVTKENLRQVTQKIVMLKELQQEELVKKATEGLDSERMIIPSPVFTTDYKEENIDKSPILNYSFSYTPVLDLNLEKIKTLNLKFEVKNDEKNSELKKSILDRIYKTEYIENLNPDTLTKNGDKIILDFKGSVDGVYFQGGSANDSELTLGSNQFIPGFEEKLIGHKVNEKFTFDLKFPDQYQAEHLRGKTAHWEIQIKKINNLFSDFLNGDETKTFKYNDKIFTIKDLKLKFDVKSQIALFNLKIQNFFQSLFNGIWSNSRQFPESYAQLLLNKEIQNIPEQYRNFALQNRDFISQLHGKVLNMINHEFIVKKLIKDNNIQITNNENELVKKFISIIEPNANIEDVSLFAELFYSNFFVLKHLNYQNEVDSFLEKIKNY